MNRALRILPLAAVALLTACSGGTSTPSAAPSAAPAVPSATATTATTALPACAKLPDPVLPHSAGELTEQQAGVYCLPRGQRVDIFLTAAKSGDAWRPVQSSATILAPANTGVMTAPLGVTPAMFYGTTDGTSVLTSSAASGKTWKVTIVVKG
ncbi:hypothetical protein DN069_08730 [Streptacidiphilus pinicola]|uniref:Uncharacterized protein n=1 Tax=Streptacidiphilus pinicola TaxID=2219663 RepID=A0A2X0KA25_9ACTN|nr:hypothetical protein [Streptacidiphilus pinicola]RAG86085.1 hypothetical protein DN069_08730 [Streptacidiphilus pinicola]